MTGTWPWPDVDASAREWLGEVWIPVGVPGYAGEAKARWQALLDGRFGADGWRLSHVVRGAVVSRAEAIVEYEAAYRHFLHGQPALVRFLTTVCGNIYDDNVTNVHDTEYDQPHTAMNHYQDISVRRVIAELVGDPEWPDVTDTDTAETDLLDLGRARRIGCRGRAGSVAASCSRSAIPCRPATASTRRSYRSTIRSSSRACRTGPTGITPRAAPTSPSRRSGR